MPKKLDFWAFCRDLKRIIFASVLCVFGIFNVAKATDYNIYYSCNGASNTRVTPINGASNPQSFNPSSWDNIILTHADNICIPKTMFAFDNWRCEYVGYGGMAGANGIIQSMPSQTPYGGGYRFNNDANTFIPNTDIYCYSKYTFNAGVVIELVNHCDSSFGTDFLYVNPGNSKSSGVYRDWSASNGFVDKVTSTTNPVSVPQNTCFVGYTSNTNYSDNSNEVCNYPEVFRRAINSYGELLTQGDTVARGYDVNYGRYYNWYAIQLSPSYALRLDSSDADIGQHGQEFLYYNSSTSTLKKYEYIEHGTDNYYYAAGNTSLSIGSVVGDMPSRTGYTFLGYFAVPDGQSGMPYINANGQLTQYGMVAIADMNWAGSSCNVLYAHWQRAPVTSNLTYQCGTAPSGSDSVVSYTTGDSFTLSTTASNCTAATGYVFAGWNCDHNLSTGDGVLNGSLNYNYSLQNGVFSGVSATWPVYENVVCEAQWEPVCSAAVRLNSKKYASSSDNTGVSADSAATPSQIYVKYSTGVYSNSSCSSTSGLTNGKITIPALANYVFEGFYDTKANATAISPAASSQMIDALGAITSYGNTSIISTSTTWYARWRGNNTKVVYDCGRDPTGSQGGRANPPSAQYATYGETFTFATPGSGQCQYTGYKGKWVCEDENGNQVLDSNGYDFGDSITWNYTGADSGQITCTADWSPEEYDVVYHKGDYAATGVQDYVDRDGIEYGGRYAALAANDIGIYPASGYAFVGWTTDSTPTFTNAGALNNEFTEINHWNRTTDLELYAAYGQQYNISYITYHNGVTNNNPNNYAYGIGATIVPASHPNYTFLGWCVNNENCQDYANNVNGYTIPANSSSNVMLYAKWQYKISYDDNAPNGTTVNNPTSPSYVYLTKGSSYTLAGAPSVTGYVFDGWDCPGLVGTPQQNGYFRAGATGTYDIGDVTCTAHWTLASHNVSFDCANGNLGTNPSGGIYDFGDTVLVPSDQSTCQVPDAHSEFGAWSCVGDTSEDDIDLENDGMPDEDVTCYAKWSPIEYNVTYYGGNCNPSASMVDYENAIYGEPYNLLTENAASSLMPNAPADCFRFRGWSRTNGATTPDSFNCNNNVCSIPSFNNATDSVFYAVCKFTEYPVQYHPGSCGGTTYTDSTNAVYGTPYTVLGINSSNMTVTVPNNYVFQGWSTDPNATSVNVGNTYSLSFANNICPKPDGYTLDLYAVCEQNVYNINYYCDANDVGVENPDDEDIAEIGDMYTIYTANSPGCGKFGYNFNGWSCWYTNNQNTDVSVNNSMYVQPYDVNCVANWQAVVADIEYESGTHGTGGTVDSDALEYGQNYTPFSGNAAGITPNTGYVFVGWSQTANNTTPDFCSATATTACATQGPWTNVACNPTCTGSDLTLYAVYNCDTQNGYVESNDYPGNCVVGRTVTYKAGTHGVGNNYNLVVGVGDEHETLDISDVNISPAVGYEFVEWQCDNGVTAAEGYNFIMPNANVECEAQWEIANGTLQYECGTGMTGNSWNTTYDYGEQYEFGGNPSPLHCTPSGNQNLAFVGWSCDTDLESGDDDDAPYFYGAGDTGYWGVSGDVRCVAVWTTGYSVTYGCRTGNDISGSGPTDSNYYAAGTQGITVLGNTGNCFKVGNTFVGWNCDNSIGYKSVGGTFTMPAANVECLANYIPNTIYLTWNLDGGTMSNSNPLMCTFGATAGLTGSITPINDPIRNGYTFNGWTISGVSLPNGYTQLKYLESDGVAYIDTGFQPIGDYKHTIIFEVLSNDEGYLCGTGLTNGSGNVKLQNKNIIAINNGANATVNVLAAVTGVLNDKKTLIMDLRNNNVCPITLDGTAINDNDTATITSGVNLRLFSIDNNAVRTRIYYDLIEQNGAPVHIFVPARRDSDDELGMFDMLGTSGSEFHMNANISATPGEFTAGPEIQSQ